METIGITGGTGFVGRHLTALLLSKGYNVVIFTRNPEKKKAHNNIEYSYWLPSQNRCDHTALKKLNAVVHLSGTPINKRWTEKVKRDILSSRVHDTKFLVNQLKKEAPQCKTFIAASGIGYYGEDRGNAPFTETDAPANDFLGNTCVQWEYESMEAANRMRTIIYRFGLVMGKEDGAFPRFAKPASFGILPILGTGNQMMSWIHIDDLASLLLYGITNREMNGVYNAVSPEAISQKDLMKTIATAKGGIKIPTPVPEAALKLLLGEMSIEVLKSATVSASKVLEAGFKFQYPQIEPAVKAILAS